ncbi:MAG TPA: DUF742 domain-containing protein [Acidimicrobiia bacterium]|nr:DUF742 domain-containing protein [Acidimicrobiia bacterium]
MTARGPEPRLPRVVRPYVLTGGRTRPTGPTLALDTTIRTTVTDVTAPPRPDTPEAARIVELCHTPTSLAELAGRITIPVGVVRVLVGDLAANGTITVDPPTPPGVATDVALLEKLLDGIRAL